MTKNNLLKYFVPIGMLLGFSALASATIVAPGSTVAGAVVSVGPGATLVASTGPTTLSATALNVTYSEWVYSDPLGLCAGCLDFVIQGTNNVASSKILEHVTTGSMAGNGSVVTDVGYNTSINGGGAIAGFAPTTINRSGIDGGETVSFNFDPAIDHGGNNTLYLIIRTNQLVFVPGDVGFIDSVTETGDGFGVAPEPNMACLLAVLAFGVIGFAYRKKKDLAGNKQA